MDNLQALQSLVNLDLPTLHEKVLIDNSVSPTEAYTASNKDIIELCSAYVYKVELTHPDFSEGKLRIAVNAEALETLMNNIFEKNNLPNESSVRTPTISIETL